MSRRPMPAEAWPVWESVAEELEARELTPAWLARRLVMDEAEMIAWLSGGKRLTVHFASQLERWLGASAAFWVNLDMQYRRWKAAQP